MVLMTPASSFLGIAIPAYKRTGLLDRLLRSIATDCPITVSDNGGNLPSDFKLKYPEVNFLTGPEVPVLCNWNRVAASQTSDWIIMPGDDDLYYPSSFTTIERSLRAHPDADIAFFGHHIIDENDQVRETWRPEACLLPPPQGFDRIRLGTPARPPSIVFRRRIFDRLGGYSEQFNVTAGDNHFYQRASLIGNVLFSPEVVSGYRVWSSGSTLQTMATQAWMQEIDLWCEGVREFALAHTSYRYTNALRDEIYAANLIGGIQVLKSRGQYFGAWRHVLNSRYPYRASALSQVKLLAYLLRPCRK